MKTTNPFFTMGAVPAWPAPQMTNVLAQTAMLAFEVQQVVALRVAKLAKGGHEAPHEAMLMVSEKLQAAQEGLALMWQAALSGKPGLDVPQVLQLYRKKVRANRRRLSS